MTYKYNGINHPPEQTGVYIEQTVTLAAGSNMISVEYDIAEEMILENWVHGGDHNSGVVKLYNETDSRSIHIYIDTVSGNTITTTNDGSGNPTISVGDDVTIGFYAIGTDNGATDQITNPSDTIDGSEYARPETFQSLFNVINIKSPRNLPQMGYKWADTLARKEVIGSTISGVDFGKNFTFDTTTTDDSLDWRIDLDDRYPVILSEIRFIVDGDPGVYLDIRIQLGDRTTDFYFGEAGNNYIDVATSSATYNTNTADVFINSLPLLLIACDKVDVYMFADTIGLTDTVTVELCGWYKPQMGGSN